MSAAATRSPRRLTFLVATLMLAVACVAMGAGSADAGRTVVLGAAKPAQPSCGARSSSCSVLATVTGFQAQIGRKKKPFLVRSPGRIVAWSIKLSKPRKRDINCFTNGCTVGGTRFRGFGASKARLSVLRPLRSQIKRGRPLYRLVAQTPVERLRPYFGTTTTFTLRTPVKVARGMIVALTTPTWAPAFATGQGRATRWRASRKKGRCGAGQARQARPHGVVGSERLYGCVFRGTRLLYSATLVKRP